MPKRVWLVILCGGTILTIAMGLRQSFGLFVRPISFDLGLGRELIAFAIGFQNLLWGLASPFGGGLADRYGTAAVSVAGTLIYAAGLALMGWGTSAGEFVLAQTLVGLGLSGAGFSTVLGAVARAAPPERRSAALGLVSAGGSFGQFAVVPGAHMLISGYGWVVALFILAAFCLAMAPLSFGLGGRSSATAGKSGQNYRAAIGEAFGSRSYILLTAGFLVCGFQVVFVATHLPAYLADKAMPAWLGAWALALVGLFNIAGSFGFGVLGGRYSKKNLLVLIYLARSVVFLGFLLVPLSEASVLVFAAILGFLWLGTVPLTGGLVAHLFGPAWMSMLYGIVFFSHQVGSFLGAWLGGYAYDRTGSYDAVWWLCAGLGVVAALLHWPIVERPVARLAVRGAE